MKKLCLFFCFIITNFCLLAHEKHYMSNALDKIAKEIDEAEGLKEKALSYQNLDKWFKLLAKLELSIEKKREILSENHDQILQLSDKFLSFLDHLQKPDFETIDVVYEGQSAVAFVNLDSKRFEQEQESYAEYGAFKPILATSKSLDELKVKTCYNFVVKTNGDVVLGDLQEYDDLMIGDKKVLLAPNHALLANGKAVMSAGEITLIGDLDFKLWMIGMTSGHYHPNPSCKKYIVDALAKLGIPREQIIVFGFQIAKLPWKLVEKDES